MYILFFFFFFFNDTATTEIYTLSLHDALPISIAGSIEMKLLDRLYGGIANGVGWVVEQARDGGVKRRRSEEHTSELQSRENLVCRLLLEKKKKKKKIKKNKEKQKK